jgi:hypothetical protein
VKAKESEIKEKELEIEKCTRVKKLKKKKEKKKVALEIELAGLKMEEEAIQVHVARLRELLNAQLEQKKGPKAPQLSSSDSTGADTEEETVSVQNVSAIYRILDVICGIH